MGERLALAKLCVPSLHRFRRNRKRFEHAPLLKKDHRIARRIARKLEFPTNAVEMDARGLAGRRYEIYGSAPFTQDSHGDRHGVSYPTRAILSDNHRIRLWLISNRSGYFPRLQEDSGSWECSTRLLGLHMNVPSLWRVWAPEGRPQPNNRSTPPFVFALP